MRLFTILLVVLSFSCLGHTQTVEKITGSEVMVGLQGAETLSVGDKVSFLDDNLNISGQGEVTKVSEGGRKAILKILSGQAKTGMSLEKVSTALKNTEAPLEAGRSLPLDEEDRKILRNGEISKTAYVIGGIVGTYPIGLGVGHAIQGRYIDKGWIFTVGELGSLALVMASFGDCLNYVGTTNRSCNGGGMFLGAMGYVGFRVWEIIDVWAAPPEINRRHRELKLRMGRQASLSPMLAPTKDGAVLGLNITF